LYNYRPTDLTSLTGWSLIYTQTIITRVTA
jgi:hypothetical protein